VLNAFKRFADFLGFADRVKFCATTGAAAGRFTAAPRPDMLVV
jgi:hypothetical protein